MAHQEALERENRALCEALRIRDQQIAHLRTGIAEWQAWAQGMNGRTPPSSCCRPADDLGDWLSPQQPPHESDIQLQHQHINNLSLLFDLDLGAATAKPLLQG